MYSHCCSCIHMYVVVPDQNDHAEPPVPSADVELFTTTQGKTDSLGDDNDNQPVTSSLATCTWSLLTTRTSVLLAS